MKVYPKADAPDSATLRSSVMGSVDHDGALWIWVVAPSFRREGEPAVLAHGHSRTRRAARDATEAAARDLGRFFTPTGSWLAAEHRDRLRAERLLVRRINSHANAAERAVMARVGNGAAHPTTTPRRYVVDSAGNVVGDVL